MNKSKFVFHLSRMGRKKLFKCRLSASVFSKQCLMLRVLWDCKIWFHFFFVTRLFDTEFKLRLHTHRTEYMFCSLLHSFVSIVICSFHHKVLHIFLYIYIIKYHEYILVLYIFHFVNVFIYIIIIFSFALSNVFSKEM